MTPQQRHIEAAKKIAVSWYESFDQYEQLESNIALALAEAENRAAWKVWENCATLCNIDKTRREISEKYGPRPSRGEVERE